MKCTTVEQRSQYGVHNVRPHTCAAGGRERAGVSGRSSELFKDLLELDSFCGFSREDPRAPPLGVPGGGDLDDIRHQNARRDKYVHHFSAHVDIIISTKSLHFW